RRRCVAAHFLCAGTGTATGGEEKGREGRQERREEGRQERRQERKRSGRGALRSGGQGQGNEDRRERPRVPLVSAVRLQHVPAGPHLDVRELRLQLRRVGQAFRPA